jgi:type I thyroxine 5'-deiodinase
VVYIQEAHPSDLWQLPSNVEDEVIFSSPKTFDERVSVASACVRKLGIEFPALLDRIEDSTEKAYTGWPDRLYVIDREGRIAYKSDPGPYGFTPGGMEEALKKIVEPGAAEPAAMHGPGGGRRGRQIVASRSTSSRAGRTQTLIHRPRRAAAASK